MRQYGTTVRNPTHHGRPYALCSMCGRYYTHLGIARHWARCPKRGHCYKHDEKLCQCTEVCAMQGKKANIKAR